MLTNMLLMLLFSLGLLKDKRTNQTCLSSNHVAFDQHMDINFLPNFGHYPTFIPEGLGTKNSSVCSAFSCHLQILRCVTRNFYAVVVEQNCFVFFLALCCYAIGLWVPFYCKSYVWQVT